MFTEAMFTVVQSTTAIPTIFTFIDIDELLIIGVVDVLLLVLTTINLRPQYLLPPLVIGGIMLPIGQLLFGL